MTQNPSFHSTIQGRKIAYHATKGSTAGIVFLGGFMSDMDGSKATHLEAWAKDQGHSFLRFDYSGHGQSSGEFMDGCIGDWAEDAASVINATTTGPQILVGSSMGGWISLLLAQRKLVNIAGLVGIAAAPDFTQDSMWAEMPEEQRQQLMSDGHVLIPSDYDAPYPITRKLIEDGRDHLVLRAPLSLDFPVHLLHGTADTAVTMARPLAILDHATGDDIQLSFVKHGDHSFSSPSNLKLITDAIDGIIEKTT